jgi:putative SOS response-associated peptidase YedK
MMSSDWQLEQTGVDRVARWFTTWAGSGFWLNGLRSCATGSSNIRNTSSPHWRGWLKPESRCLVPFNSFGHNVGQFPELYLQCFTFVQAEPGI